MGQHNELERFRAAIDRPGVKTAAKPGPVVKPFEVSFRPIKAVRPRPVLPVVAMAIVALFGPATPAQAGPIFIPSGLAPGSTYYLAFVTAGTTTTDSSNIDDYDAYVTAQANMSPTLAALGTTWKVIGSTPTVDAVTHIGVTGPVYLLGGARIATGSADLFDGMIDIPLHRDQFGFEVQSGNLLVGTGTDIHGNGVAGNTLGTARPEEGKINQDDFTWIAAGTIGSNLFPLEFYGISGALVVPTTPGPEPASIMLLGTGVVTLIGRRFWRRRSTQHRQLVKSVI
jgi:hypothetical protein